MQPTLLSSSSGSDATGRPIDDNSNWTGKPGPESSPGPSSHTPYIYVCQDPRARVLKPELELQESKSVWTQTKGALLRAHAAGSH